MALLNFMRPKWKHGKEQVRLAAVRELDTTEIDILSTVVREDPSPLVVDSALEKLNDSDMLEELLRFDPPPNTKNKILQKINCLLKQKVLESRDDTEREEILLRIDNPDLLLEIATTADDPELRLQTVHRVDDQELLVRIMEQNCGKAPALAGLNKVNDSSLLERLSRNASNRSIRRLASDKLAIISSSITPSNEKDVQEKELQQFVKEAEELTSTIDFDLAAGHLKELGRSWSHIDPKSEHPLRTAFDAAKNRFEEHQQNFLLQEQEETFKEEDYTKKIAACETVCTTIEALIGSADADAEKHFRKAETEWKCDPAEKNDPIVFELADRFEKACQAFISTSRSVKAESQLLADLSSGCGEVENLLVSKNFTSADNRLTGLEKRLKATPFVHHDSENIRHRMEGLRQKIAAAEEEKAANDQKKLEENLAGRRALCDEIEKLLEAEDRRAADIRFNEVKKEWDALEKLPDGSGNDALKRFTTVSALFTESRDQYYHEQDWQRWANKTKKEELVRQAESLDAENDLPSLETNIKTIQVQWKEVGPVPKKDAALLWDRFKTACDRNFERLQPYFKKQEEERGRILARKEEICREAEALLHSLQWKETAVLLKEKQDEWKELGFTSKKDEDALYSRFRAACDVFFKRRRENYQEQEKERSVNLEEKIKLCETAEGLASDPVWQNGKKLRDLQTSWKEIGPAPRDLEEALWKRFRTACDSFFAWVNEERQRNLQFKIQLCEKVEDLLGNTAWKGQDNRIADELKKLQQEWKEIGPVPNERKDAIWKRFNEPCETFFASRKEIFAERNAAHLENQRLKENLIQQAEIAARENLGKETGEKLQELQKLWKETGSAGGRQDKDLFSAFQDICHSYFQDRRLKHEEFMNERLENLKKKEAICLLLENIIGVDSVHSTPGKKQALDLAERFRLAREANFVLAGARENRTRQKEEIVKLQQEWKKIGPVPQAQNKQIWERYNKCLDSFFNEIRGEGNNKTAKK